jgi:hypothetical protein
MDREVYYWWMEEFVFDGQRGVLIVDENTSIRHKKTCHISSLAVYFSLWDLHPTHSVDANLYVL